MYWIHHHHMIIAFIGLLAAFGVGLLGISKQGKSTK
ncbi:hypothetical protein P3TCK_09083 [Photobacterium profundum 3TCK]|jgi:hypothetical protein|uniref:Uncharacterized protein n=1 Tax=Photobacterium profundum 3TCK TaxID=314280 RepID=Q1YYA8_9GAMM|nr:hypothetical protein P3TCK_09083 [Photobacterium profundum 3TCK]